MKTPLAVLVLASLALAACGDDDPDGPEASGAWARTSPAGVTLGAVYMTLETDEADQLVGVSVPADVAAVAEIHETVMADGAMSEGTMPAGGTATTMPSDTMASGTMPAAGDDGGTMSMRPVEAIELPAGEEVVLEPGGYHIMLIDLAEPLAVGESIEVTLEFAVAEPITVEAEIRDTAG